MQRSGIPAGSERRVRGWTGVPEESPLGSCDTEEKCVRGVPWNPSSPGVVHILPPPRPELGDRALLSGGTSLLLLYARSWDIFLEFCSNQRFARPLEILINSMLSSFMHFNSIQNYLAELRDEK